MIIITILEFILNAMLLITIVINYIFCIDSSLKNNYIFTVMLNKLGINGKITITYYLFFYLVINNILKIFTNDIISLLILLFFMTIDIFLNKYLLEEIINKFLD